MLLACRGCLPSETKEIIDWVDRMIVRYGDTVYGYGLRWDWGQALRVEMEGPDYDKWSDLTDPPAEAVERALAWEKGSWPAWITFPCPRKDVMK